MHLQTNLLAFALLLFAAVGASSQTAHERAVALCSQLTVEEKATIMMDESEAIERLNIPRFAWWSEALHGLGRNGLATMFPQCIGMAAAFDTTLIYDIYTAVSDEVRAKNTELRRHSTVSKYRGLSIWTPNVNVFRDPRWGRGQETYGEDPFVNAIMGRAVVRGLQGPEPTEGHPYRKLLACAKHYAVHSGPEKTRHSFDITGLSPRDLWETYMPAFESLVRDVNVREVMCAYQSFEGAPCCGSTTLLQQILRERWGFDGLVVSDCGAIGDFWRSGRHGYSADAAQASAHAVLAGTDVECGKNYKNLPLALRRGEISEEQIDQSVVRLLTARYELGDFDADSLVEWTRIGMDVVASREHRALSLRAARESMVLLQNRDNLLPLRREDRDKIIVMGPNAADSLVHWGIYFGQPLHTSTVVEGVTAKIGNVAYAKGCELTSLTTSESLFGEMTVGDARGVEVTFWNTEKMEGESVLTEHYTSALAFDNGGNTVFAPGVNLEHFSLRVRGVYHARQTEKIYLDYAHDDDLLLVVNGDTLHNRWNDYMRSYNKALKVQQGRDYDIVIEYNQRVGSASLNFNVSRTKPITVAEAVSAAEGKEIVIFVGGISPLLEREEAKVDAPGFDNGDRTSIELPEAQRAILQALHDAGKRIVLVNCSGSAVALEPETKTCDAILQAWYAGEMGGEAIADVLFGDYNPSGVLPVTFYASDADLPAFDDYSMTAGKGRTYRYFTGAPLFAFGHGLSYTTFEYSKVKWDKKTKSLTLSVKNTGTTDGDHIVLVYVRDPEDTDGPLKSLRAFSRLTLKAGETKSVAIPMTERAFALYDSATQSMRVKSRHTYQISVGAKTLQVAPY